MNNYHHLSHPRIIELFRDLADIAISKGTVNSILSSSPALLEDFEIYLRSLLQKSDLLGIDETSFRVAVMNFWLWVFQNRCFSYFYFDPHRSSEVLKEVIGEYFDGTILSDFYSAYNRLQARRKQKCNAHLLRELAYIVECEARSKPYITAIFKLLLEAKEFKEKYAPYKPEQLQDEIEEFKDRLKALCERSLPVEYQEAIRIQKRLINHQNEILTFLEIAQVPFDNNTSEQAIRAAVVHRKVIQCFRTVRGANNYARWLSLIQTLRKQKIQIFPAITRLFKGSIPLIQLD
jgi:transposase